MDYIKTVSSVKLDILLVFQKTDTNVCIGFLI